MEDSPDDSEDQTLVHGSRSNSKGLCRSRAGHGPARLRQRLAQPAQLPPSLVTKAFGIKLIMQDLTFMAGLLSSYIVISEAPPSLPYQFSFAEKKRIIISSYTNLN